MNQNNINKIKTKIKDITNNLAEKLKISEKENRHLEQEDVSQEVPKKKKLTPTISGNMVTLTISWLPCFDI